MPGHAPAAPKGTAAEYLRGASRYWTSCREQCAGLPRTPGAYDLACSRLAQGASPHPACGQPSKCAPQPLIVFRCEKLLVNAFLAQ